MACATKIRFQIVRRRDNIEIAYRAEPFRHCFSNGAAAPDFRIFTLPVQSMNRVNHVFTHPLRDKTEKAEPSVQICTTSYFPKPQHSTTKKEVVTAANPLDDFLCRTLQNRGNALQF